MTLISYATWAALPVFSCLFALGQQPAAPGVPASTPTNIRQQVDALSQSLASAEQRLQESQRQIEQMQQELKQLRQRLANEPSSSLSPQALVDTSASLEERQQALQAAVKLHDQVKAESASKYPVRITGLVLFNAFLNRGLGDNIDVPAVALRQTSTSGDGAAGASLRQTVLGLEGNGPNVLGARTSASVDFDFFSGISYSDYGTSAGVVRMRTADIALDWPHDHLDAGMSPPLISPLSPTSFATVAEPALSGAGNLWTWAPQLRYAHIFGDTDRAHLQLEAGLWDSASAGYNANQLFRTASPAENSNQPAYESRLSWSSPSGGLNTSSLQFGVSGFYSRQSYPGYGGYLGTEHLDSWATAFDLRTPLSRFIEVSAEGYRGRALGGLGGGVYKDVITGTDPVGGYAELHGLNAIGGWAQTKFRFTSSLESNLSFGLDDGFARDFHAVVQPSSASATQLRARNRMAVANLIYRPRTYLILSPEYRRVWSSPITGSATTLGIFTLSLGYQF